MNCIDTGAREIIKAMQQWFQQNSWAIATGVVALIASYALYGYRITALEAEAATNTSTIATLNIQQQAIQVSLAQIETDIQYIKQQLQDQRNTAIRNGQ